MVAEERDHAPGAAEGVLAAAAVGGDGVDGWGVRGGKESDERGFD